MLREDEPDGAIILVLEDKTKNKKKTLAISKIKGNDFRQRWSSTDPRRSGGARPQRGDGEELEASSGALDFRIVGQNRLVALFEVRAPEELGPSRGIARHSSSTTIQTASKARDQGDDGQEAGRYAQGP